MIVVTSGTILVIFGKITSNGFRLIDYIGKSDPAHNGIRHDVKIQQLEYKQLYILSWVWAGIGIIILNYDRLETYELTVNRMVFMAGILALIFIPFITSLKLGIFDVSFEKEKNK